MSEALVQQTQAAPQPSANAAIALQGVEKAFGRIKVIHGVDL